MFSIAAINDVDSSRDHWQPLAPTKEAQEFRLTQMYHESLLHLQAEEYVKAQKLFQAIIQDPLCIKAEMEKMMSFNPMLQLRFLAFKNLAEAFFKQGPHFYQDALQCFLEAVSIDGKDVALWNRLGTVACLLGLFSIARKAFEQALLCSPHHWVCMEKLAEVLIAIGDEVACLSVVKRLLKISPSHPRAELIIKTIEENSDFDEMRENTTGGGSPRKYFVALRGIDKLQPQHHSLDFSRIDMHTVSKSLVSLNRSTPQKISLNLEKASWIELTSKVSMTLEQVNSMGCDDLTSDVPSIPEIANAHVIFLLKNRDISEPGMHKSNQERDGIQSYDMAAELNAIQEEHQMFSYPDVSVPTSTGKVSLDDVDNLSHEKRLKVDTSWGLGPSCDLGCDRTTNNLKERDASTDEEPPLERRSTRLERIRTRKFDRNEETENAHLEVGKGKVSSEALRQLLEPYIICKESVERIPCLLSNNLEVQKSQVIHDHEEVNVLQFLREYAVNGALYHLGKSVLEKISCSIVKPLDSWKPLVRLERYVRNISKGPSVLCRLFLAEVYMDLVSSGTGEEEMGVYLQDCDYHLCRIVECIAVTMPMPPLDIAWDANVIEVDQLTGEGKVSEPEIKGDLWSFWVRFYWISGHVRYFQGNCEKGREDFQKCLAILEAREEVQSDIVTISLPYCNVDKEISAERVRHKIYELQLKDLLAHSAAQMLEKGLHAELIELLAPNLFAEQGGGNGLVGKKHADDFATELTALNMLISACERSKPKNLTVALQCYERRMEIHFLTAGLITAKNAKNFACNPTEGVDQMQSNLGDECTSRQWFNLVAEDVRLVSRCTADFVQALTKSSSLSPKGKLLGQMQQLLLTFMCHIAMISTDRRSSGMAVPDSVDQVEATSFVDAAVSFCRLQHIYSITPIKLQVELLVMVHDVLAERGLCCAGKDCEGGEGVFLKMAIKHLLALEMKLKTCSTKERLTIDRVDRNIVSPSEVPERGPMLIEYTCKLKDEDGRDTSITVPLCSNEQVTVDETLMKESKFLRFEGSPLEKRRKVASSSSFDEQIPDIEKMKMDLGLDIAMDQSFFCLYGLNLRGGSESTGQDGLAVHSNTSLGDYQTKEQCAEVFQYLLPYARVCTKACLVKLRKVLRAIGKQFPEPPSNVLENNVVDVFLDDLDLDEDKISSMVVCGDDIKKILSYAFNTPFRAENLLGGQSDYGNAFGSTLPYGCALNSESGSSAAGLQNNILDDDYAMSGPYCEVYGNLYYVLARVEEMCASDKWPGFVFTKEGEDFVEQNVKLFKYDLLYNPFHFESWHKLANLFDEEVDLMLNDGSKTLNATEWQKNIQLTKRVETGRRRTRRCLLMSLALAKTPEQQSQVHELLALVYYDTLQNVAPSYNQRQHVVVRNLSWAAICQKSHMHFEKALSFKPEWIHLFYLGKLCEKMEQPCERALSYYKKAAEMNPSAVDPLYRLHASRLKLLCSSTSDNVNVIQVVAKYCYLHHTKEQVFTLLQNCLSWKDQTMTMQKLSEIREDHDNKPSVQLPLQLAENYVGESWNLLFEDCVKALEVCLEGELKHYHKARFRLAQSLYARNGSNDIERAKEELGFCFKSNRSLFTINMWEIDGSTKRNRRKTPGSTGARRGLEISMPESSRKFITCLRKYLLFYLDLCEKTYDVCTLERAYSSLRVDKKFYLCLADMINVTLGKYIHTLGTAICHADLFGSTSNYSLRTLLEKFFNFSMDHGSSWPDVAALSLTEAGLSSAEIVSEAAIYGYIHRYIHSLECDNKVDVLESVNEKIRKRFKSPKLVNEQFVQVCKHAAIAWCRTLCAALSAITPSLEKTVIDSGIESGHFSSSDQLVVELRSDELLSNVSEFYIPSSEIEALKQKGPLLTMARVRVKQAFPENMEKASVLLRQTFTFYRDCAGPFPVGINLFFMPSGSVATIENEALSANLSTGPLVGVDLSVPRKLLLWAYNLVQGRTSSIAEVVKFCEDQAKNKLRRVPLHAPSSLNCQERPFGAGTKDVSSSGCAQFSSASVIDEKGKSILEDHEAYVVGLSLLPSCDGAHVCNSTVGLLNQFAEDSIQVEDNADTMFPEYTEPEKECRPFLA